MSYSFSVKAADKLAALGKVRAELDKIVALQPAHQGDHYQAQNAATIFVALLADDDTKDVSVSLSGSIYKPEAGTQQVSVSVSAALVPRA